MPESPQRSFVAITLPDAHQNTYQQWRDRVRRRDRVRWIAPQNLHVTLDFWGNQSMKNRVLIAQSLSKALSRVVPFEISFGQRVWLKRVLTMTVDPEPTMQSLSTIIQSMVDNLGTTIYRQQRFTPHLTLGRLRNGAKPFSLTLLPPLRLPPYTVRNLDCYTSQLTSDGPHYSLWSRLSLLSPSSVSASTK